MTGAIVETFSDYLRRRLAHEPVQHILGTTEFYGLEFACDARALIPRADSESVVETALKKIPAQTEFLVADLGTGSGCLLAAILANRPEAGGTGVEASPGAANLARENLTHLGLAERACIFEGRWADWEGWSAVDLIISNPPYIASEAIEGLMPEVRLHDPRMALDGGKDGLEAYRQIIQLSVAGLKPGAWLVFEIGYDQKDSVSTLLKDAGFSNIETGRDLGGNDRVVAAKWPNP